MRDSARQPRQSQRQGAGWELDADELDRYMSGQPSKQPRFDPYGRSQTSGRTERIPARQPQPDTEPRYQEYEDDFDQPVQPPQDQWVDDDYGYQDDYGYEEFDPEPEPEPAPVRQRQPRPQSRSRQYDPEYDDDLYDDPYVDEEEEALPPRRPQRRQQRPARQRQARQAPNFTLPPAIADAPLVKDRNALIMLGVAVVSLLAMVIIVMTGRDGLDPVIFTHVNANGEPQNLQTSDAIWNLPLIATMVTVISGLLAWFLARWGEFLPRFLLGGAIGVQFIVWVAVIAYIF